MRTVVLVARHGERKDWDPHKHPRDHDGRFADEPGGLGPRGFPVAADYDKEMKDAAGLYCQTGQVLNYRIRRGDPLSDNLTKIDAGLSQAFEVTPPLTEPRTVYRGGSFDEEYLTALKPGAVLSDDAYVSTTTSMDYAVEFSTGWPGTQVVFTITMPPGSQGADLEGITGNHAFGGQEQEVLLNRRTSLLVTSVARGENGRVDVNAQLLAGDHKAARLRRGTQSGTPRSTIERFVWLPGDLHVR